jgi:hypothetical protein
MYEYVTHTADDEMPYCHQCDHICTDFFCEKLCGPEHGWNGYIRTERIMVSDNGRTSI